MPFHRLHRELSGARRPAPLPPVVLETPSDDPNRLRFADVLGQTLPGTFRMLPTLVLEDARRRYVNVVGESPVPAERPTDEQLSALFTWIKVLPGARARAPIRRLRHLGPVWEAFP